MVKKLLMILNILLIAVIIGGYFYFEEKVKVDNPTVAVIDGQEIREDELVLKLKEMYAKETLDEMINKKVIYKAAEKYKITANESEIERQYQEFSKDYSTEEEFVEYLGEQMGWTKEKLYEYIEYYILWEKIATKDVSLSDEELREYYETNRFKYREPEKYHLEQIIVETKEETEEILKELDNGSDFNTLAKERSSDVFSLATGGDIGFVSIDDPSVQVEVVNTAEGMQINEIATVELSEGYAVIRLIDRKEAKEYSFEEVKDEIRRELALNQVSSLPEVLEQLKEELNVKIVE